VGERYVPEGPRHLWLRLVPGEAEALTLADDEVSEVRVGHPASAAMRALTGAAERALAAPDRPLPPGRIPEGEILRIGGHLAGRRVARSWRPDQPGQEEARALAREVEALAARLERAAGAAAYVRAALVEADRAALLRREGRFAFRPRAEAARLGAVGAALGDPGRFAAVPADELAALRSLSGSGRKLFVEDGETFEVTLFAVTGGRLR